MNKYANDKIGLAEVAEEARHYLRLFANNRAARQILVDDVRPFVGPYPMNPERGRLTNGLNHLLNRLLWRQHALNQRLVQGIDDALLLPSDAPSTKPLLQVIAPNDVSENITGGSARLWGLCGALGRWFHIELISVTRWWRLPERRAILPDVDLLICPLRGRIDGAIQQAESEVGAAATFLTMGEPNQPFPMFDEFVRRTTPHAAAVLMVGPFLYPRFRQCAPNVPLFYDMHDVIREYVGRMAGSHKEAAMARVDTLERAMIRDSRVIASVCDADADAVGNQYPEARGKICIVPNGVHADRVFRSYPSESLRLARGLGLRKPLALFMGSVLRANIDAMTNVIERLAPATPDAQWAILGVMRDEYVNLAGHRALPENVVFCGRVPESEKEALFALAALAVAPMGDGTGSSLKIPDYVAHGKPVVTTPIGLRGHGVLESHVDVVALEEFPARVRQRLLELQREPTALDARAAAAWNVVRAHLDWSVIGERLYEAIEPHLAKPKSD